MSRHQEYAKARQETRAFNEALLNVRVGMTTRDLERLNPNLRNSAFGKVEYTQTANGRSEWWRYDRGTTLFIVNGIVTAIHY